MKKDSNTQNTAVQKTKKKRDKRKIFDRLIIAFLAMVLVGGATVLFLLFNIISGVDTTDISSKINATSNSVVLASNGKKFADLGEESRENIKYTQIPQSTIDAFLSIEDSRFYSHNGFDMPRFISSAINNLKSGELGQGGSTLTMQTIDNYFTKKKEEADKENGIQYSAFQKVELKIQEIYRGMKLEDEMSKEDIITAYFNKINFGNHARGIQRGAQYYFGKNVEQLNMSESAFLAGVVNAPNLYNPYNGVVTVKVDGVEKKYNYYQYATERRDEVLDMMLTHGYISETECKLAKTTKLAFQVAGYEDTNEDPYRAYLDKVVDEVKDLTGDDPTTTQMTIYTALDMDAQKEANNICNGNDISLPNNKYYQFGFAVSNVSNGEIVAIGPGLKEDASTGNYKNRAYDTHQTGSSIKPIMDYALTFDKLGWSTVHTLKDEPISITGGRTQLQNSNRIYQGNVLMEQALGESLNTTAIKSLQALIEEIGVKGIVEYMNAAGFTDITTDNFSLGFGIGGSDMTASPVQMAAAYAALANGGYYIKPHTVTKVVYGDGSKTIEPKVEKTQIMSSQAAYLMSDILDKTVNGNWSSSLIAAQRGDGYTVYGKTGTSDYDETTEKYGIPNGAMRDEWMIGYTNEYAIATWSGFDGVVAGGDTYITDEILFMNNPGTINKRMLEAVKENPSKLTRPDGISNITIEKGVYPYESAVSGSNNAVTGLIKSEFASKIGKATITPPASLASFQVTQASPTGSDLTFTFTSYPGGSEDMIKRYGAIVYRVTIKVNGSVVEDLTFEGPNGSSTGKIPAGSTGTVCGFYQYKNSTNADAKSNEICQSISVGATVNREGIVTAINNYAGIVSSDYTVDSWAAYSNALAAAKTIANKTSATQAEIDQAVIDLNTAYAALVKQETPVKPDKPDDKEDTDDKTN